MGNIFTLICMSQQIKRRALVVPTLQPRVWWHLAQHRLSPQTRMDHASSTYCWLLESSPNFEKSAKSSSKKQKNIHLDNNYFFWNCAPKAYSMKLPNWSSGISTLMQLQMHISVRVISLQGLCPWRPFNPVPFWALRFVGPCKRSDISPNLPAHELFLTETILLSDRLTYHY